MAVKNLGYTPDLRPIFLNSQYAFFGTHHPSKKIEAQSDRLQPSAFSLQPMMPPSLIAFILTGLPLGNSIFLQTVLNDIYCSAGRNTSPPFLPKH
jgi:hypothetical protein